MVSSLVLQLEYYMVTGLDVWDLLVGLRPHLAGGLETVCETLADTFHRQPGPVQQYYYVRHMAIKTSLYRSVLSRKGRGGGVGGSGGVGLTSLYDWIHMCELTV